MSTGFVNLKDDSCMSFEISWASNVPNMSMYYELLGDRGGIRYEATDIGAPVFMVHSVENGQLVDMTPKLRENAYGVTEFGHFIDCMLEDKDPVIAPPEQTMMTMELIDAIYRSADQRGGQVFM